MDLKHFQNQAIEKLATAIRRNLKSKDDNPDLPLQHIIFKSPTGSGKTIMLSETLKQLSEDDILNEHNLVFMWLAPMKLHAQSYKKLKDYLQESDYQLINIDDGLPSGALKRNTVLFSNWEKLTTTAGQDNPEKNIKKGDWTNIATKQGETRKNLIDILAATEEAGTRVVLIVDESHQAFYSEKSQRFVQEIVRPTLVIEASATPKFEQKQAQVIEVPYEEVVESGLIKKQVIINNDLGKVEGVDSKTVIESLIDLSLAKRKELKSAYESVSEKINPLMLIQLPNGSSEAMNELDKTEKTIIEALLADRGITYSNGKLAVWLSEEKTNLDDIEQLDSPVEVLIFKQAVALGWDCPRAQLLLMRRDVKSESFKVQTVGRILRMPKGIHYDSELLDTAFVYSDLQSITIDRTEQDPLVNLIKYQQSRIREVFKDKNVIFPDSVYLSRTDYGDLRSDFNAFLTGRFNDNFGLTSLNTKAEKHQKLSEYLEADEAKLTRLVLADVIVQNIDELTDHVGLDVVKMNMDQETIDYIFNLNLREFIKPFTGFARTRAIVYPTLKNLFAQADFDEIKMKKMIACSAKNQEILKDVFSSALDSYDSTYQRESKERRDREMSEESWSVAEVDVFSDNYIEIQTEKNIYDHYYRNKNASENEERFERLLDSNDNVLWWHKNGEKMRHHFAVAYNEQMDNAKTRRNSFYPDYVVRFKDDTIGIFETKSEADTAPDSYANKNNPRKADALQRWMQDNAKLGVWGGIVNRVKGDEFMLQADALTQEMALSNMRGENTEMPEVAYNCNNWKKMLF